MANKDVRKKNTGNGEKSSLDVNVNENANSRILAKLFQYKSPNGEYEILQSLLNYIYVEKGISDFRKINVNDKPIITTEETLNQGNDRIDILVRIGDYAIIFENKLFNAPDQKYQLARYINITKKTSINEENIFVIYLSRKGDEPAPDSWMIDSKTKSSYSESFEDRYANLSFKDDILRWLKDCVLPYVRKKDTDLESALVQYINYLDRMFMKNNDNLTKWLEEELKLKIEKQEQNESSETDRMVKIHCLEKVEGLIDVLHEEGTKKKRKITVQKLSDFIKDDINKEDLQKINALLGKTDTQEGIGTQEGTDLLNKVIAVIENLRDDCGDELLKTFNRVSKKNSEDNSEGYFDTIHVTSRKRDAYCTLKNKKWEGEIRFIWNPFFFNAKNKYKLTLEILKKDIDKFNDLLGDKNNQLDSIVKSIKAELKEIPFFKLLKISHDSPTSKKTNPLFRLIFDFKNMGKLIEFKEDDQEKLFTAIYKSLSGVIEAIDAKYP